MLKNSNAVLRHGGCCVTVRFPSCHWRSGNGGCGLPARLERDSCTGPGDDPNIHPKGLAVYDSMIVPLGGKASLPRQDQAVRACGHLVSQPRDRHSVLVAPVF